MQTGLDMNNNSIENLKQPTNSDHAVNKQYVDTNFPHTNAGLTGNLSMNNHKITNLGLPTSNNDAVNKQFVINSSTHIYLYGLVNNMGIVNIDRFDLRIENVYTVSFGVYSTNSYNNVGDAVSFNVRGSFSRPTYNFTHPNGNQGVNISVNRKYERMTNFTLTRGRNLPFYIIYKSLCI